MNVKKLIFSLLIFFIYLNTDAQIAKVYTRADSLRGTLTPLRTCYDVTYYHLDVKVDPKSKTIEGTNRIIFKVVEPFTRFQIDLYSNLIIEKIIHKRKELKFSRQANAVFVDFPNMLVPGTNGDIIVHYKGSPVVAQRPPWDGGFVWSKDLFGDPWVGVTCQGAGASLWWPNKDHLSDEPDSMFIGVTVPKGLMNISNGRLRRLIDLDQNWTKFVWFVNNPINNYDVTLNIAKYEYISDTYINGDTLTLDYYVLRGNSDRAKRHFEQVKPMLTCFEKYLGKYPFYRDGYKLVESPYLGMEHQSAIAYGNKYLTGYQGQDISTIGLDFDYIIIHESAHEWWGNNVSYSDMADMWISESFCTYSESLYVDCVYGSEVARKYMLAQKPRIQNKAPMIGVYGVNQEGDKDMYLKGSVVLHTLRNVIGNDELWFSILKGIQKEFALKSISKKDIVQYINQKTGKDFNYFFDQYYKYPSIPVLQYNIEKKDKDVLLYYRWKADVKDFKMPIKLTVNAPDAFEIVEPTNQWRSVALKIKPEELVINNEDYYFNLEKLNR